MACMLLELVTAITRLDSSVSSVAENTGCCVKLTVSLEYLANGLIKVLLSPNLSITNLCASYKAF